MITFKSQHLIKFNFNNFVQYFHNKSQKIYNEFKERKLQSPMIINIHIPIFSLAYTFWGRRERLYNFFQYVALMECKKQYRKRQLALQPTHLNHNQTHFDIHILGRATVKPPNVSLPERTHSSSPSTYILIFSQHIFTQLPTLLPTFETILYQ
jgi:hypothetical protein